MSRLSGCIFYLFNRFKVKIEFLKPEKIELSTTFKGMDYIDVPAGSHKDYRLEFLAYKEGTASVKVKKKGSFI